MELATQTLDDYSISPRERKASESRLAMGKLATQHTAAIRIDPEQRLLSVPVSSNRGVPSRIQFPAPAAHGLLQGSSDGKHQRYIQRARFLAISEFGPQSLVYHEGRAFRVDRALLKDAGDRPDGMLTTQSRAIARPAARDTPGNT